MSIERIYHCDGPDCERHAQTATQPPYIPGHMLLVREQHDNGKDEHHFCSWDCLMKYAAKQPVPEVIEWDTDE